MSHFVRPSAEAVRLHSQTSAQPFAHSAFLRKMMSLTPLTADDLRLLAELGTQPCDVAAGTLLEQDDIMIVEKGWLACETVDAEGALRGLELYLPGEVMGPTVCPDVMVGNRWVAKSNAAVCRTKRTTFQKLLSSSSRISAMFLAISELDQVRQELRLRIISRNAAASRVSLFILQTLERLRLARPHSTDRFHCPLTQADMGAYVGLSSVHVSRTLTQLERKSYIRRHKAFIELLNADALADLAGYRSFAEGIDLSWLPQPPAVRNDNDREEAAA